MGNQEAVSTSPSHENMYWPLACTMAQMGVPSSRCTLPWIGAQVTAATQVSETSYQSPHVPNGVVSHVVRFTIPEHQALGGRRPRHRRCLFHGLPLIL